MKTAWSRAVAENTIAKHFPHRVPCVVWLVSGWAINWIKAHIARSSNRRHLRDRTEFLRFGDNAVDEKSDHGYWLFAENFSRTLDLRRIISAGSSFGHRRSSFHVERCASAILAERIAALRSAASLSNAKMTLVESGGASTMPRDCLQPCLLVTVNRFWALVPLTPSDCISLSPPDATLRYRKSICPIKA